MSIQKQKSQRDIFCLYKYKNYYENVFFLFKNFPSAVKKSKEFWKSFSKHPGFIWNTCNILNRNTERFISQKYKTYQDQNY